jgi:pyruvate kinase
MKLSTTLFAALSLMQASDAFVPRGMPSTATRSVETYTALNVAMDLDRDAQSINSISGAPKETTVAAVPKVAQRWRKSTKQLVTLGPASSSREMIEKLFLAGADLFRLNFSHGSQEQKKELLMTIREIEEKYAHPIGILGDLQGPKLRVRIYFVDFFSVI